MGRLAYGSEVKEKEGMGLNGLEVNNGFWIPLRRKEGKEENTIQRGLSTKRTFFYPISTAQESGCGGG